MLDVTQLVEKIILDTPYENLVDIHNIMADMTIWKTEKVYLNNKETLNNIFSSWTSYEILSLLYKYNYSGKYITLSENTITFIDDLGDIIKTYDIIEFLAHHSDYWGYVPGLKETIEKYET